MDTSGDTSDIDGKSANEKLRAKTLLHSTTVARGGQHFCFVCKKASFKIAQPFKTHVIEEADIANRVGGLGLGLQL